MAGDLKELGIDRVRDCYRRCLGLPAAFNLPNASDSADGK